MQKAIGVNSEQPGDTPQLYSTPQSDIYVACVRRTRIGDSWVITRLNSIAVKPALAAIVHMRYNPAVQNKITKERMKA